MKRIWHFDHYWNGLRLSLAFHFDFPNKKHDYYESQYSLFIELFGLCLSAGTWLD